MKLIKNKASNFAFINSILKSLVEVVSPVRLSHLGIFLMKFPSKASINIGDLRLIPLA